MGIFIETSLCSANVQKHLLNVGYCKCTHLHYIDIYFLHEIRHLIIYTTLSICSFGNNKPALKIVFN